jgi:phosphoribosylformimino-5-aminoimidazole carboxamide ribotide isomerase
MQVIPAVDILNGKCARLVRGRPEDSKVYFDDPVEAAKMWEEQGAEALHIVDLDATLGSGDNFPTVKRILEEVSMETQVGGGIRTIEKAEELCGLGATRVILGTLLIERPENLDELRRRLGSRRIVVALDYAGWRTATHGWSKLTDMNVFSLASRLAELGAGWILFSAIERDGTMAGPDLESIRKMVKTVDLPVIASGGVGSLRDVVDVAETGAAGLVVGKALYEKAFSLREAKEAVGRS